MSRKSFFTVAIGLIVVVTVCIVFAMVLLPKQTLPTLSIDRVYSITEAGQTVLVNVTLSNVPSATGCTGWRLRLTWNPEIAKITTFHDYSIAIPENVFPVVFEGPYLKQTGKGTFFHINTDPYALESNLEGNIDVFDLISSGGGSVSGSGVIFSINFTLVHVGTTTIEFSPPTQCSDKSIIFDANGDPLEHVETDGLITKEGSPIDSMTYIPIVMSVEIISLTIVTFLLVHKERSYHRLQSVV